MATLCNCDSKYLNTGLPASTAILKESKWLVFAPAQDLSGNPPEIALTDVLDEAFFEAKFTSNKDLDRWYPYGGSNGLQNINSPQRADPTVFETNEGNKYITRQGSRDYQGHSFEAPPSYIGTIESMRCKKWVVFGVDDCGKISGKICTNSAGETVLRGFSVNEKSIYAIVIEGNPSEAGRIQMNFQISMVENDANIRVAETTYDWSTSNGLIQAEARDAAATATEVTVNLVLGNTGEFDGTPATGLTTFAVQNLTTNATVTVSSSTESPAGSGSYTIAYASGVSASDALNVTGVESGIATNFKVTATA